MKRIVVIGSIITMCFTCLVWAVDFQIPTENPSPIPMKVPEHLKHAGALSRQNNINPPAPDHELIHIPEELVTSFYDYMPGNYCGHPIKMQPEGGLCGTQGVYFLFHCDLVPDPPAFSNRRQYFAYVFPDESITYGRITSYDDVRQGYPGIAIHPKTGNAIVSWHENYFPESELDCVLTYDDFYQMGICLPGFWKTTMGIPQLQLPNEFIWPLVFIGPSPAGQDSLRIYHISSNHTMSNFCEHTRLLYMDVPNENYQYEDLLQILVYGNWSEPRYIFQDLAENYDIRPHPSFAVSDVPGKVAFMGYAGFTENSGNEPIDPGFYVFESYDYGQTWDMDRHFHTYPYTVNRDVVYRVENIPQFGDPPYDHLDVSSGFPGNQKGGHRSILYDGEGNLHMPTVLQVLHFNEELTEYTYVGEYMFLFQVDLVYKADRTWEIRQVPNMPGTDPGSGIPVPWTWSETDTTLYPWMNISTSDLGLFFHENIQHQAINKENDWMVQVWADGTELLKAENDTIQYPTPPNPDYLGHPIIYVSVSANNGETWSEPIELSDIYTDPFGDQITVYPYVAPTIVDLEEDNWGEIFMYYFDDNDYGCNVHNVGPCTGGKITYMSLKIDFSSGNIDGTVTLDGGSGNVEDVEVTVNHTTVHPDDSGYYLIEKLLPGTGVYKVTASLDGYIDSTVVEVDVFADETTTIDIILTPSAGHMYGDIDDNGEVQAYDASLALQIALGIMIPEDWQIWAGDVDGNGLVQAYDASLILQYALEIIDHFPVEGGKNGNGNRDLEDAVITVTSDGNSIRISTTELDSLWGVTAWQFDLVYDTLSADYEGYSIEGTLSEDGTAMVNDATPGLLRVGWFAAYPIIGAGDIITLEFSAPLSEVTVSDFYFNATEITNIIYDMSIGDEPISCVTGLQGNYPNPFSSSTTISFSLMKRLHVRLSVYNIKGQLVETLVDNEMNPGVYEKKWNVNSESEKLTNGVYFYKLETHNKIFTKKMILIR